MIQLGDITKIHGYMDNTSEDAKQKLIKACQPPTDDWEHYADRLHDIAYKRGYEQAKKDLASPARPKGHWKENIDNSRKWDKVRFYCSECGEWQTYGKADFCPKCGADMKGEQK